ncbi:MAG: aspartate kinase [Deltaproteobacteria bacterium]|nr:aspartate kinase [Deltaproteobacteria bacterium]
MKVIKVGGGCLHGNTVVAGILDLMAVHGPGNVFVVSALNGVTDLLLKAQSRALADEDTIAATMAELRARHMDTAAALMPSSALADFEAPLEALCRKLERLFFGLSFTREATPRLRDAIAVFGERLSALLLAHILMARGLRAACHFPEDIGMVTDGRFGDATADIPATKEHFHTRLASLIKPDTVTFVPGFYGLGPDGEVTTFGRGGSDYSAAVVAVALGAEILEIWKETAGFMSADPRLIPEARLIPALSFDEAAELAYFGAKILHPRTVEPLRATAITIAVKNTLNPTGQGSVITSQNVQSASCVKSVAHNANIGVLKVQASGVGARPGILGNVAGLLGGRGINIRSVVTSQTCISLLLDQGDLEPAHDLLAEMRPGLCTRLEAIRDLAMVALVGHGMSERIGVAARCFTAVAEAGINIEMVAFGPSPAALYFLVRSVDLAPALRAVHATFFEGSGCPS